MTAIASPTCRTLSCASKGCCGLWNSCWTGVVHLLGKDSWVSGTGGSSRSQIGAAQRQGHAGRRGGARQIDRADARMRDRAPDEGRMQHARQFEIGDELSPAGQQPAVLAPQQRAAD